MNLNLPLTSGFAKPLDQEGTTLLFVVAHDNIVGEQKANIKSDGDSAGTNAAETKKRRCTASCTTSSLVQEA